MILKDKSKSDNIELSKKNIRKYIKEVRSSMRKEDAFLRSYTIYKTLIDMVDLDKVGIISCYIDFDNEVATYLFIMYCLEHGIDVVVPKIHLDDIVFKYVSADMSDEFYTNQYGILEPSDNAKDCDINDIDIFVVPALAFDESGCRLGYGKGYYDRVFKKNRRALRIGLSYCFQVLPFLPSNEHDEFVDIIVTEYNIALPTNNFNIL